MNNINIQYAAKKELVQYRALDTLHICWMRLGNQLIAQWPIAVSGRPEPPHLSDRLQLVSEAINIPVLCCDPVSSPGGA